MSKKKDGSMDLVGLLTDQLNKGVRKGDPKIAFSFTDPEGPQHVKSWIKSGVDVLDILASNRPDGGVFPCGRVITVDGLQSSGKSLLAMQAAAWLQSEGGTVVYLDTERTIDEGFGRSLGINFDERFVYATPQTLEQVWGTVEAVARTVYENAEKYVKPVLIVVDSLNSVESDAETQEDIGLKGYATGSARLNSSAFKRIIPLLSNSPVPIALVLVRQVRYKMNAMPNEDPYVASGGIGPNFYASLQYRTMSRAKLKYKEEVVGMKIRFRVYKSKIGPAHRHVDVNNYFSRGIDNALTTFEFCKSNKLFGTKTAQTLTFTDESTSQHWEFTKAKFREVFNQDPDLRTSLNEAICDFLIRPYEVTGEEDSEGLYDQDKKDMQPDQKEES